jgi:hypothetical protein
MSTKTLLLVTSQTLESTFYLGIGDPRIHLPCIVHHRLELAVYFFSRLNMLCGFVSKLVDTFKPCPFISVR